MVRAGYGIYQDTSVYLGSSQLLAQQAPLSTSLNAQNSATCPLTLASGIAPCSAVSSDTYAVDPNFRVGYAQIWRLAVQRDLPAAMQITATYLGIKGTRGVQEFLPNTYPIGATNPCPSCPLGFEYRTSGGDSTRESGEVQLRRRLRAGFTASIDYTFSKSIDDDAFLGGQGHTEAGSPAEASAQSAARAVALAHDWLDLRAERSLSTFDQRHLLTVQAQYTSGRARGWNPDGRLAGKAAEGVDPPHENRRAAGCRKLRYLEAVPGAGFTGTIRPRLTGSPVGASAGQIHLNAAAYTAPVAGQWGTAGRDSIPGPGQFSLDSSLERTFRPTTKFNLIARIDATNLLNHAVQRMDHEHRQHAIGLSASVNAMRSLETTLRPGLAMRILSALFAFAIAADLAGAQQIGQNKPADASDNFTLSVKVHLVIEAVVVKDKDRKPIQGLTAKDFAVTEDGVPQTVSICEHQNLAEEAKPLPVSKSSDEDLKLYKELARSQIKPETRAMSATRIAACLLSISTCRRWRPVISFALSPRPSNSSARR